MKLPLKKFRPLNITITGKRGEGMTYTTIEIFDMKETEE